MSKNSMTNTLIVTIGLCLLCSLIISTAAVALRPLQEQNHIRELNHSILQVAGIYRPGIAIETLMKHIEVRMVDLERGTYVDSPPATGFDMVEAARTADRGRPLDKQQDIAGIGFVPRYAKIYLVHENNQLHRIVLPVYGYGLWSTLYGFIALEPDANTVYTLQFYQHGETPGLGGRVDDPKWRALWHGKKIYAAGTSPQLSVVKVPPRKSDPDFAYKVDGLSGATLTSLGVSHMIKFWFGQLGYRKFLEKQFYAMATK